MESFTQTKVNPTGTHRGLAGGVTEPERGFAAARVPSSGSTPAPLALRRTQWE